MAFYLPPEPQLRHLNCTNQLQFLKFYKWKTKSMRLESTTLRPKIIINHIQTMASRFGGSFSSEHVGLLVDMEDEDDLFEINLDVVDSIPPAQYDWDNYFTTASGNALLANCLMPVTDISRAVPMDRKAQPPSKGTAHGLMMPEPVPFEQLLRLPFLEASGLHWKAMKHKFDLVVENEAHLGVGSEPLERS